MAINRTVIDAYFTIPPNWGSPVYTGKGWRTNVLLSLPVGEQRSRLRKRPTTKTSYTVRAMSFADSSYYKQLLFTYRNKVIGVPIWSDNVRLTASAIAGTDTLSVSDTTATLFEKGNRLILINEEDHNSYEVAVVKGVSTNSIVLFNKMLS